MKILREAGWARDRDGVASIYKDPDTNLYYEITIAMKGTSLTSGPTWTTNGVGITDSNYVITGTNITITFKVSSTGEATVSYTDNIGNEEQHTFRWKTRDR